MPSAPSRQAWANTRRPSAAQPQRARLAQERGACRRAKRPWAGLLLIGWHPSGGSSFRNGRNVFQQPRTGFEPGLVVFIGQLSPDSSDLFLGLCKRGYRAAHLRDEFVQGSRVQSSPLLVPSRDSATPKIGIAEKIDQRPTLQVDAAVWEAWRVGISAATAALAKASIEAMRMRNFVMC